MPDVGTTIFTEMSAMAAEHDAINLSQGFPDFPLDPALVDLVKHYMISGFNQYAPMPGVPALRDQISKKLEGYSQAPFDPDKEITITSGATEALFAAITALVREGDEVIIFDPSYDLYAPAVTLSGAKPVHIELLLPEFSIDWTTLEQRINSNTKAIIINNPNNPAGSLLLEEDLQRLGQLAKFHELIVISDEVYEHMVYDNQSHCSILGIPDLRSRGVAIFSFGKTFHATGWKIGYSVSPEAINSELRKVHQFLTFSVNTPIQMAIADYLSTPDHYLYLRGFFQQKRDLFLQLMEPSRFEPLLSRGTYFQLMRYRNISDKPDREMAAWMTKEHGVASIPVSVFYEKATDNQLVRFCFAKKEETLRAAAEKLCRI